MPPLQLSMARKIAYAAGGMGMNLPNLVVSQWIFKRYVPGGDEPLVPVALFSTIFLLGRITDGVSDPLVAYWSDRLRSRWGRRIPFVAVTMVPLAVVFFLLWNPPIEGRSLGNALFAFALVQLYFVLYTAITTPYLALLPELTSNPAERVSIATWQAVFVMLGTAVFAVVGVVIEGWGWGALGLVVGGLTLASFVPTVLFIRERRVPPDVEPAGAEKINLLVWVRMTLRNRPFLFLVTATSCYWFGLNLLIMLVPYFVQDYLGLDEGAVTLVMGPFLVMNTVCFIVFNGLAKRLGKFPLFVATLAGTALAAPLLSAVGWLDLGSPLVQTSVAMAVIGVPVAGFMMLPYALLADVVDHDEQLTGRRREAIYFGVQAVFQKVTVGLSVFVFGMLVLADGQVSSVAALKVVPFIAAAACLVGLAAFWRYPLREGDDGVRLVR